MKDLFLQILPVFLAFPILVYSQNLDSLQSIIQHSSDQELRVSALISLGKHELYTNTDESEKNFRIALKEVQYLGKKKWESDILNQLGVIQYKRSQMDSALVFYKMSYSISERLKDTLQMAINHSNVANILRAQHKYDLAIKNFLKALPIYEQKGKVLYQAMTFGAIGTLHIATEEYDKALTYFEKAKLILKEKGNVQGLLTTNLNIAICYENLNKRKEAKALFEKLLVDTKTHKFQRKHAIILGKLGKIFYVDNEFLKAKFYYSKALEEFSKSRDIGGLAEAHLYLGKIAFENKNYNQSLNHYKQSYSNVQKTGVDRKSPEALMGIIKSLQKLHRENEAIAYYDLLLEAKDSIFNIERRKTAAEINTKFDVAQKEKEISIQQLELEKKDAQLSKQKQLEIALASLIALLLGLLYFVRKANKFKRLNEYNTIKKNKLELEQKVLRNQMNPHFIFNALNSIQSYVSDNKTTDAETYLAKFSRLVRLILENSRKEFVPFDEDYASLDSYLSLEQVRFDDSFDYNIEYPDNFNEISIPPMLIQPFVENAIKHGIASLQEKGMIRVSFKITSDIETDDSNFGVVTCTISDNGIGLEAAKEKKKTSFNTHKSMSLQLTKDRLQNYTTTTHRTYDLTIKSSDKGTSITLEMPYTL